MEKPPPIREVLAQMRQIKEAADPTWEPRQLDLKRFDEIYWEVMVHWVADFAKLFPKSLIEVDASNGMPDPETVYRARDYLDYLCFRIDDCYILFIKALDDIPGSKIAAEERIDFWRMWDDELSHFNKLQDQSLCSFLSK